MDVGKLLCKIGLHNGEPVLENGPFDGAANHKTMEDVQKREVRCTRCGSIWTEFVNPIWIAHP